MKHPSLLLLLTKNFQNILFPMAFNQLAMSKLSVIFLWREFHWYSLSDSDLQACTFRSVYWHIFNIVPTLTLFVYLMTARGLMCAVYAVKIHLNFDQLSYICLVCSFSSSIWHQMQDPNVWIWYSWMFILNTNSFKCEMADNALLKRAYHFQQYFRRKLKWVSIIFLTHNISIILASLKHILPQNLLFNKLINCTEY
jgi:hypothetical protein